MEKTISELRDKSAMLSAYIDILEDLSRKEKWYQHCKTTINPETGEEIELDDVWEDDTEDYATVHLKAIRSVASAIRKMAGV